MHHKIETVQAAGFGFSSSPFVHPRIFQHTAHQITNNEEMAALGFGSTNKSAKAETAKNPRVDEKKPLPALFLVLSKIGAGAAAGSSSKKSGGKCHLR